MTELELPHGGSLGSGVSLSFVLLLLVIGGKRWGKSLLHPLHFSSWYISTWTHVSFHWATVEKRMCNGHRELVPWESWATRCSLEHLVFSDPQGYLSLCQVTAVNHWSLCFRLKTYRSISKSLLPNVWTERSTCDITQQSLLRTLCPSCWPCHRITFTCYSKTLTF